MCCGKYVFYQRPKKSENVNMLGTTCSKRLSAVFTTSYVAGVNISFQVMLLNAC